MASPRARDLAGDYAAGEIASDAGSSVMTVASGVARKAGAA